MATPIKDNTTALEELLDRARALPSVPGSVEQATPTISVSSGGLITASATQAAGVVAAGTKSATKQLPTKGATTIEPSDEVQTAVSAGTYVTGDIKVAAQSGSAIQMKTGRATFERDTTGTEEETMVRVSDLGFMPDLVIIVFDTDRWTENGTSYFGSISACGWFYGATNNDEASAIIVADGVPAGEEYFMVYGYVYREASGFYAVLSGMFGSSASGLIGGQCDYLAVKLG